MASRRLMIALDNSHEDIANLLLDHGANPHLTDWWGRSALYIAVDMNSRGSGGPGAGGRGGAVGGVVAVRVTEEAAPSSAGGGALENVRRLLEMGVDPNTQLNMHRPGRGGNTARLHRRQG